mgnify:CR=1 FL=1
MNLQFHLKKQLLERLNCKNWDEFSATDIADIASELNIDDVTFFDVEFVMEFLPGIMTNSILNFNVESGLVWSSYSKYHSRKNIKKKHKGTTLF